MTFVAKSFVDKYPRCAQLYNIPTRLRRDQLLGKYVIVLTVLAVKIHVAITARPSDLSTLIDGGSFIRTTGRPR